MSDKPEQLEHQHVEEVKDPEARIFVMVAGAMMVAAITFGVLNTFNIIHM